MPENLPIESQSSESRPINPLIRSLDVNMRLVRISQKDFDLIFEMVKSSVLAFDSSVETQSGKDYACNIDITVIG